MKAIYPMENSNQYFSDIVYTDIFPNLLTIYNARLFNVIFIKYPTHPRHRFQILFFFMQNANNTNNTGTITNPITCPKPVILLNSAITVTYIVNAIYCHPFILAVSNPVVLITTIHADNKSYTNHISYSQPFCFCTDFLHFTHCYFYLISTGQIHSSVLFINR